jgi:hypothetical protein
MAVARANPTARLFMTVPGVGVITALSVASSFDDASRFSRSSSAGAYLGLTPPPTIRVWRDKPQWAHLQAGERDDQEAPLRSGHDASDAQPTVLDAQSLGPEAGEDVRVQEGEDRRGPEDGRDPARHVEDQHPIPLEPGGGGITARLTLTGCVAAGTLGADQSVPENAVPSATTRTTSVDPTI